jgi:outer membrane lipoprotein
MKKILTILSVAMVLTACAPVLSRELMREGERNVSFSHLREAPDKYKGKLFILGGLIVNSRLTEQGSQIEALYVPVDSYGSLEEGVPIQGRFLAIYPKEKGLLDPVVYKKGRDVTLAGEFVELRKGKIDEMAYDYPVFEIRQIHLWEEPVYYYSAPYYYYPYYPYYPYPYVYDRWGWPYSDPIWWGPPPW